MKRKCIKRRKDMAMLKGEADVVAGLKNKLIMAMSKLTPSEVLAEMHRKLAEPASASQT
jgi:uncharacterized protein